MLYIETGNTSIMNEILAAKLFLLFFSVPTATTLQIDKLASYLNLDQASPINASTLPQPFGLA